MSKIRKHRTEIISAIYNDTVDYSGKITTETNCKFFIDLPHPFNPNFIYLRISSSINVLNKDGLSIEEIVTSTSFKISKDPPILGNEEIVKMVHISLRFLKSKMIKFNIIKKLNLNIQFSCKSNPVFVSNIRKGLEKIGFQVNYSLDY
jgi:hypothetical protein